MKPELIYRYIERFFVVALLLQNMGIATTIFYPNMGEGDLNAAAGELHGPIALTQAAIYGLGGVFVLIRWKRILGTLGVIWPLTLFVMLAPISAAWSIDPLLTLRRSVLLLAMFFVAVYLGERYSIAQMANLLAKTFCLTIAATLVLFAVAHGRVIDPAHAPAWKGLFSSKNLLGFYMTMAFIVLLLVRFKRHKWIRILFLFATFGLMLISRSMTSVATGCITLAIAPFWLLMRSKLQIRIPALAASVAAIGGSIAIFFNPLSALFLRLLGKDATLTGRTEVWKAIAIAIQHRPLLGYGYECFWLGLRGESLKVIVVSGWLVPHAHNGYLELLLAFGFLGAAVFVFVIFRLIAIGIHYLREEKQPIGLWPLAFLTFMLLHNLGESDLMTNTSTLTMLLFFALYTSLALDARRARMPVRLPVALPAAPARPLAVA